MSDYFNNLKLAKKMLVAPVVVLFFLILLSIGTYFSLALQRDALDDIYNNRFKQYQNSARIQNDVSSVHGNLSRILNWMKTNYSAEEIAREIKQQKDLLTEDVELIKKQLGSGSLTPEEKKYFQSASDHLIEYQKSVLGIFNAAAVSPDMAIQIMTATDNLYKDLNKFLKDLLIFEDKSSKKKYDAAVASFNITVMIFLVVVAIAVVLSFAVSILVTRIVLKPINRTIHVVKQLADGDLTQKIELKQNDEIGALVESVNTMRSKMNHAVGQAMQISGGLSDSASQEAAAIEETSASLDEIASMTRQNAANTEAANQLMLSARDAINKANESMGGLKQSMIEIAKASEQTQKIVKSIDEIAFQTNLLALNASVEAARAGEAGAGFAVVADEVRNLAMRATQSAKGSSDLIGDIVRKVKNGENLVTATSTAFSQVTGSANKVVDLMSEIAAASKEQSQGIDQVNRAIAEMNVTTQQTAGNAENLACVMTIFKTEQNDAGRTSGFSMKAGTVGSSFQKPAAMTVMEQTDF
ncbi:MAG: hypothetical protein CVU71_09725 [Deltaproteobacteria bacterium HGW-Deltaproteobacteria-6]|jgi:methyl-accepting chemotaxis protein|nr:MAG: hypothetical protein CVU71_09725 [Deltaproteobacteria bacterium HGW-Deltaproteobacteria-6]